MGSTKCIASIGELSRKDNSLCFKNSIGAVRLTVTKVVFEFHWCVPSTIAESRLTVTKVVFEFAHKTKDIAIGTD